MDRPSKGILGKRRISDEVLEQNNQASLWPDFRKTTKPRKRVRFAEIEDVPMSNVRTPIHHLNLRSDSDELMLPIPQLTFRCTGEITTVAPLLAGHSMMNPSPLKGLETRPPDTKDRPARMKIRDHNLPVRPLPVCTRQKTRWDPTTGKRIPIAFPIPSAAVSSQSLGIAEPAEQDDYEQRLSCGLSNASLG